MSLKSLAQKLHTLCPTLQLLQGESMAKYTTFRMGGPAELMACPATIDEARAVLSAAYEMGIRPLYLGNGSNLLVRDEGVDALVLYTGRLTARHRQGNALCAQAGCLMPLLSRLACEWGLGGLEFAQGIPGSLGGAVVMNAGAYGGEMGQIVSSVTVLTPQGEEKVFEDGAFSYRHSRFSDGEDLIVSATLTLHPREKESIAARMEEYRAARQEKQPLEFPSAGSMFKRPQGAYAAALIDQCGLKGLRVGGAQVSEKHAGFVVNRGGATCRDVLQLVEQVQEKVQQQTGYTLEREVKVWGDQP